MMRRVTSPAALLLFGALTVLMTWPQARHLATHVPDSDDPLLSARPRARWGLHVPQHRALATDPERRQRVLSHSYLELTELMRTFPDEPSIEYLKHREVDFVVLHSGLLAPDTFGQMTLTAGGPAGL